MPKLKDISGQKFYHLTAIRFVERRKMSTRWEFVCDCGTVTVRDRNNVGSGKVRSCGCVTHNKLLDETLSDRLNRNYLPEPNSGCWIWIGAITARGYGQLTFRRRHLEAHRASWEAFKGEIPDGMHVLHKCNVSMCINPGHLYIGTNLDNCHDRIKAGTQVRGGPKLRGENHPMAILGEQEVREIRRSPEIGRVIAEKFKVSKATVYAIKSGRLWKHLENL